MPFETLKHRFLHRHTHTPEPQLGQSTNNNGENSSGAEVSPRVKGTPQILGLVSDPRYNRDSGGSARFGNRTFWTYRDTQLRENNGKIQALPIIASTGSWSDYNADGQPALQDVPLGSDPLNSTVLVQYGDNDHDRAYFPILDSGCDSRAGMRNDGSRIAVWPDQPPLVTHTTAQGKVTAYNWIHKAHIKDLSVVTPNPATTLYRVDYDPSRDRNLPRIHIVHEHFWKENEIAFGAYGNLMKDDIAYLYGKANGKIALAKVPAHEVEDVSKYEYFVNGSWTHRKPSIKDTDINIPNAGAGGQGTFYYFEP